MIVVVVKYIVLLKGKFTQNVNFVIFSLPHAIQPIWLTFFCRAQQKIFRRMCIQTILSPTDFHWMSKRHWDISQNIFHINFQESVCIHVYFSNTVRFHSNSYFMHQKWYIKTTQITYWYSGFQMVFSEVFRPCLVLCCAFWVILSQLVCHLDSFPTIADLQNEKILSIPSMER